MKPENILLTAATPVTRGSQVIEEIAVSRDGKWLLYSSDVAGSVDAYRLPLVGGEPERLTTESGRRVLAGHVAQRARGGVSLDRPGWALRNNRLYFGIDQRESDVWVIEILNR